MMTKWMYIIHDYFNNIIILINNENEDDWKVYVHCVLGVSIPAGVWSEVKAALAAHNNDNND